MPKIHEIAAHPFDHCFSDYVTDWSHVVVGVEGRGQTVDQMIEDICDEVSASTDDAQFPYGDHAYAQLRASLRESLRANARFWPADENGNEIDTDANPETDLPEEQPSYWFRITVASRALPIRLDNLDREDGTVLVLCDYPEAAREDRSIDGTHWEVSDGTLAYAITFDRPGLVAELQAEGYDVDTSEYSEPTAEDMARLAALHADE